MLFNVYQGNSLAASFEYGREPSYYGEVGQRVRRLVGSLHAIQGAWTDDRAFEWVAQITDAGFTIYAIVPPERRPLLQTVD